MQYINQYNSPLGKILMAADEQGLTGLWFSGQKYYAAGLNPECIEKKTQILSETEKWLDIYFSGKNLDFIPQLHLTGSAFRLEVWNILSKIPYGTTVTYSDIAENIAKQRQAAKMSARAIGGAVSHNPVSIIIPCHRVIGKNHNLTGYAAGIDKKIKLLYLEKAIKKEV